MDGTPAGEIQGPNKNDQTFRSPNQAIGKYWFSLVSVWIGSIQKLEVVVCNIPACESIPLIELLKSGVILIMMDRILIKNIIQTQK
mmetsp:Transcript_15320/g.37704  ORF Transcript_15320/g.37704 Transcript_15320/m.37704 type:complete len:86 (+) Transcript_15320:585-842(+)